MFVSPQEVRATSKFRIPLMPTPSGLIYRAMGTWGPLLAVIALTSRHTGFPLDFFPVLFAVPRVVGWLAHWRQVRLDNTREAEHVTELVSADDASGRWGEDLEAKTSMCSRAVWAVADVHLVPSRSTSGPRNGTTKQLTAEGDQTRQGPWQRPSNILGESLRVVFSLLPLTL